MGCQSVNKLSTEEFMEKSKYKRIKKLIRLSRCYLQRCKELLRDNPDLAVFFIMLTFRDNEAFLKSKQEVKSAIGRYMQQMRQCLQRQGKKVYTSFWVLEVQSRGVPHYHIFLVADADAYIPYPDQSYWKWGFSGLKRVPYWKISKSYLSKYLAKSEQKDVEKNQLLKGCNLYRMYVCQEMKEFFLRVIRHTYDYFRFCLSNITGKLVRRVKKKYVVDGIEIERKGWVLFSFDFVFWGVDFIRVRIGDQVLQYDTEADFFQAFSFVYSDCI